MLIKSGSVEGAWVEARVTDRVVLDGDDPKELTYTIYKIVEDENFILMDGFENEDYEENQVRPSDCTLVHRPFHVGDQLETLDKNDKWINVTSIYNNSDQRLAEILYKIANEMPHIHRHANPALREVK